VISNLGIKNLKADEVCSEGSMIRISTYSASGKYGRCACAVLELQIFVNYLYVRSQFSCHTIENRGTHRVKYIKAGDHKEQRRLHSGTNGNI
jgi:hypothetical protein